MYPLTLSALLATSGLLVLATGLPAPGASTQPAESLVIVRVEFPDGKSWILGPNGVGRPFAVGIVLSNNSDSPLRIWDPNNSEGAQSPRVVLTSSDHIETTLIPPGVRRSGVPTSITIKPHQTFVIKLELLRLIDRQSLPPGKYTVQAQYENRTDSAGGLTKIWTGSISAKPDVIEIVRPGADSAE